MREISLSLAFFYIVTLITNFDSVKKYHQSSPSNEKYILLYFYSQHFFFCFCSIDKILHSLGPRYSYTLPKSSLPNPLDIVLLYAQRVFPLDYILMTGLVLYFVFCSMGGISHIGIWLCCVRVSGQN